MPKAVTADAGNVALDRTMNPAAAPHLARIPGGDFLMGAADGAPDERPVHRVHLSEYFIGRFPVSNDEYARFIRATAYPAPEVRGVPLVAAGGRDSLFREFAAPYIWAGGEPPQGCGNHPVVLIRYDDAVAYCNWLSAELGRACRLPTEAEWERAARGGVDGAKFPWGDDIDPSRANYLGDPAAKHQRGTRPAGTYPPNAYGLCDVIGNVWEWVSDWYSAEYYGQGDAQDPRGPSAGSLRILRGASWVTEDIEMLRCAYRHKVPPDTYTYSIGFRIVCTD